MDQATDRRRRPRGRRLEDGRFVRLQQPGSAGPRDGQPHPRGRRPAGLSTDPVARMLTQRQTLTIGVLTPQALSVIFSNPFFGAFSEGVARSPRNPATASTSSPRYMAAWPARWTAPRWTASWPSACPTTTPRSNTSAGPGLPIVLVDSTALPEHGSIEIDDAGGAKAAADHLHRRWATAISWSWPSSRPPRRSGSDPDGVMGRRLRAYRDAFGAVGVELPDDRRRRPGDHRWWPRGDAPRLGGRRSTDRHPGHERRHGHRGDARHCATRPARARRRQRRRLRRHRPRPARGPPLTTVHQPIRRKGEEAVRRSCPSSNDGISPSPSIAAWRRG